MNNAFDNLEKVFSNYPKPTVSEFLKPEMLIRADTHLIHWSKDFLARDVRSNDANEAESLVYGISATGFAYFFPIWLGESLSGRWAPDTNIYMTCPFVWDERNWEELSGDFHVRYSDAQLLVVQQAMQDASELEHFEAVKIQMVEAGNALV